MKFLFKSPEMITCSPYKKKGPRKENWNQQKSSQT